MRRSILGEAISEDKVVITTRTSDIETTISEW